MVAYNWVMPIALTALAFAWFLFTPYRPNFFGTGGVSEFIFEIFEILPAFFIAALAAVASFGNEALDEELGPEGPSIRIDYGEEEDLVLLTMRRLLCYLFSYLTVLGLLIFVGSGLGFYLISDFGVSLVFGEATIWVVGASFLVLVYLCFCVLIALLQGVFFLSERIHQRE